MARPQLKLDAERIADLAYRGLSDRKIAALLDCSEHTISRRFGAICRKKRAERKMEILDAQTKAALAGDARMLIWLGRVELGQSNRPAAAEAEPVLPGAIKLLIVDGRLQRPPTA